MKFASRLGALFAGVILGFGSLVPSAVSATQPAENEAQTFGQSSASALVPIASFEDNGLLMNLPEPSGGVQALTGNDQEDLPENLHAVLEDGTKCILQTGKDFNWKVRSPEESRSYCVQLIPDLADRYSCSEEKLPYVQILPSSATQDLLPAAAADVIQAADRQKSATGLANETIIYRFLRQEIGLNIAAACGVLANLYDESRFDPNALANDTGGTHSFGICQWNSGYSRLSELVSWCSRNGYDHRSLEGQLQFMKYELENVPAYGFEKLKTFPETAQGAAQAAYHFASVFERVTPSRYTPRSLMAQNTYWPVYKDDIDRDPLFCIDEIAVEFNRVHIKGWAYDPDDPAASLEIHVYTGRQGRVFKADRLSPDVNKILGLSGSHRFDIAFETDLEGSQPLSVYALNLGIEGGRRNKCIESRMITLTRDRENPQIELLSTEYCPEGFRITCKVTDNDGIARVQFPVWTEAGGQDDLMDHWTTSSSCAGEQTADGIWQYLVRTADHNNESGNYIFHIYAWDHSGNQSGAAPSPVYISPVHPDQEIPVIGNVQIRTQEYGHQITFTVSDNDETASASVAARSEEDGKQIFKAAEKQSDGSWMVQILPEEFAWTNPALSIEIQAEDRYGNQAEPVFTDCVPAAADASICSHPGQKWSVLTEADCENDGIEVLRCVFCLKEETRIISSSGHESSDWKIAQEATELQEGRREKYCLRCNVLLESETLEKLQPGVQLYRLYNPNSGEHFYTADLREKDFLTNAGWKNEGKAWRAPHKSNTPVYRLFNPHGSDHHYTISQRERDYLIRSEWVDEGIGWYSDDARQVPVFRQYNPNAETGAHNFTVSEKENEYLAGSGWKAEGIAWYGLPG